jgi:hypothetical protein
MTLRIFEKTGKREDTVALHGWLSAAEVEELERVAAGHERPLKVDLAQLAGIDSEGLRALLALRVRGARLAGASPYVALLLKRAGSPGDTDETDKGGQE